MKIYTNKPKLLNQKVFDEALKLTENEVEGVTVGITFVSKAKIKKLNLTRRGINKVTDVLSFPMFETKKKGTLKNFINEADPLTKELEIGDIVICLPVAKKQAKQYKHSLNREINFLALHGFLHLLGYDHLNTRQEKEMFSLAEKVLTSLSITRGEHV